MKTILALEKSKIPPNANFERINPNIDHEFFNLKVKAVRLRVRLRKS